jgi:hypothetical protein
MGMQGFIAAIGGFLLLAVLIWAMLRNRSAPKGNKAQAEKGAHDLYRREAAAEHRATPDHQ